MLGQTCWLILLTQSWPSFNNTVGGRSYWLLCGLNVAAGVCFSPHLSFKLLTNVRFVDICLLYSSRDERNLA